jgi:hypothetical protein
MIKVNSKTNMECIQRLYSKLELLTVTLSKNPKERYNLEHLHINGKTKLKGILGVRMWTGFIWLWIGSSGRLL